MIILLADKTPGFILWFFAVIGAIILFGWLSEKHEKQKERQSRRHESRQHHHTKKY